MRAQSRHDAAGHRSIGADAPSQNCDCWNALANTNRPGTGIIDNLVWTAYLEWRLARVKRWKIGVVRPHRPGADQVLVSRTFARGERPEPALEDLVRRCEPAHSSRCRSYVKETLTATRRERRPDDKLIPIPHA